MNFTIHLYSVQSQRYGEEHLTFLWGHRNHTLIFQGWALHEFSPQQGNCIHSPDFISPLGTCILLHSLLWLGKVIGLGYHLEEDGVAPSPGHRWISVQFSRVRLFATPWTAAHEASLSITNSWSFLKLMSIKSVMPPNHLILCCPFLVLPSIFPSIRERGVSFSHQVAKVWSFSFSISPSNEHPGLISFRMDWLDLLAVQGTPESSPTPQFKKHQFSGTQLSL